MKLVWRTLKPLKLQTKQIGTNLAKTIETYSKNLNVFLKNENVYNQNAHCLLMNFFDLKSIKVLAMITSVLILSGIALILC